MKPCLPLLALLLWLNNVHAASYEVILRNGRLVDGTGNPAYFADVAVKNGRIAEIGRITGHAKAEIDATGLIIALASLMSTPTQTKSLKHRARKISCAWA